MQMAGRVPPPNLRRTDTPDVVGIGIHWVFEERLTDRSAVMIDSEKPAITSCAVSIDRILDNNPHYAIRLVFAYAVIPVGELPQTH
jgi:hypothetical protein